MNEVSEAEFFSQVGDRGLQEVTQLANWLLTTDDDETREIDLACRYAPSIITRNEAQVFGLSEPRFAIRLYLENETGSSLINLRRIDRMRAANPRWGKRMHWLKTANKESLQALPTPKDRPRELLRRASRVADCLLQPPRRLDREKENWVVLQADLGREYGEVSEPGELLGTPYVKHIPLAGGGLCAQAVCFMATALLHEFASGLHGLLEVTALAQHQAIRESEAGGNDVYEMQLSGLDYGGMTRYFGEVGLRAIKQVPKTMGYSDPGADWMNRNDAFTAAARAYLRSGMPIVLTVDVGRLGAPAKPEEQLRGGMPLPVTNPVFAANDYQHPEFDRIRRGEFQQRRDHAVLLVGCREEAGATTFLVNDPTSLPFLKATTAQLAEAGYYLSRWDEGTQSRQPDFRELRSLHSLPVTPAAVKLPLLWWLPENEVDAEDADYETIEHWRDGLFAIVPLLQSGAVTLDGNQIPYVAPSARYRHFRLVQLKDLVQHCANFLQGEDELPDIAWIRGELMTRFGWKEDHWAWIQFVTEPCSIWIFDAEQALPEKETESTPDTQRGFLRIGVWREEDGTWAEVVAPRPAQLPAQPRMIRQPVINRPESPTHRLSGLTSCSLLGLSDALKTLSDQVEQIELFAFPQNDVGELMGDQRGRTPLDWMAANADRPKEIHQLGKRILEQCEEAGVGISSLATYFPELAHHEPDHATKPLAALRFLVRLSEVLRQGEPDPDTIQISAGSRIQGVWPGKHRKPGAGGQVFVANVMSRPALGTTFLARLARLIEESGSSSPVRFAIDLEPGPLQLVNDWQALEWFASQMEKPKYAETLGRCAGFNLNIAHWSFLAGIRPEKIKSESGSQIRSRILHAHISDCGNGQLSLQVPGVLHDAAEFDRWLDLIEQMILEPRETQLHFSGFLSIDLTACKDARAFEAATHFFSAS